MDLLMGSLMGSLMGLGQTVWLPNFGVLYHFFLVEMLP